MSKPVQKQNDGRTVTSHIYRQIMLPIPERNGSVEVTDLASSERLRPNERNNKDDVYEQRNEDETTKRGYSKNYMDESKLTGNTLGFKRQAQSAQFHQKQSVGVSIQLKLRDDKDRESIIKDSNPRTGGKGALSFLRSSARNDNIPRNSQNNPFASQQYNPANSITNLINEIDNSSQKDDKKLNITGNIFGEALQKEKQNERMSKDNIFNIRIPNRDSDRESGNIFQKKKDKKKEKNIFEKSDGSGSSDSDGDGNIFVRGSMRQTKASYLKSGLTDRYFTLDKILDASRFYKNYLLKGEGPAKRMQKKISLDIPQLFQTFKIPKQLYFKPERIEFKRQIDFLPNLSSSSGGNYLCKINKQRSLFYMQDLKLQQINNLNGSKCVEIKLQTEAKMSSTIQYDHINHRFYLFSNKEQKIFIYSETSLQILCKVPVQKHVNDPSLHFYNINGRNFLLIIGGYVRIDKQIAQGNKFIQIFQIYRWEVALKSRLIKLIIGRISPIVLALKEKNQGKILILGGHTLAKVNQKGQLSYNHEKDINQSTNMTGISMSFQQIVQLFDYQEHAVCSNISVKLANPLLLRTGLVIVVGNTFLLILPNSGCLFQIKVINKEINVIQSRYVPFPTSDLMQRRELSLRVQRNGIMLYCITQRGFFQIKSYSNQKQKTCSCSIY